MEYHKIRDKGPWNIGDWILLAVALLFLGILFVVLVLGSMKAWWGFVILLGVPFVCGTIRIYRNRAFCDHHDCEMIGLMAEDNPYHVRYFCSECSQELQQVRLDKEREIRIEEVAEGYKRALAHQRKIHENSWM